jgi:tetrapyrrole methylase family protein / MazG family protein
MKDRFEKLYLLQRSNLIYSPWAKNTTLIERVRNIKEEVDEAITEIENQEYEKFKDEIGDVLWDCLGAIARAENEGHLTVEGVLEHIYQKFAKRKPFLLEERYVTKEEENEIWQKVKDEEKK